MEASRGQGRRLGFLGGAALGVGLVVLVGAGWMLAGRSGGGGEGDTASEAATVPSQSDAAQPSPHEGADSSVVADPRIDRLRADLVADPERLELRKRLALELLRRADFYAAFEEAGRILERSPDDVDGLFVAGAVRVRMGQSARALPLLERVLEQVPDHVPALTAKGQALLKSGHAEAAVEVWNRALELSGGSNAQVEEFLRSIPAGAAPHPVAAE